MIRFLFLLFLLSACSSAPEVKESTKELVTEEPVDSIKSRIQSGEFKMVLKDPSDPKNTSDIRIEYAFYDPADDLLPFEKKVNELIIERVLIQNKETHKKLGRIKEEWFKVQLEAFKKEYLEGMKEVPEMSIWQLDQGNSVDESYKDFVVLSTGQDVYAGGAHGSVYLTYDLIDRETANVLKLKDIVADLPGFNKIAEKHFRKTNQIDPSESLEDAGYWFENGFYCSENFYFEGDKMIFIYNQYEVAPYVMGMPSIEIPLKEIRSFLKLSLLKIQ
jgi:hypothetical protein